MPPTRNPAMVDKKTGNALISRYRSASQFSSSTKINSHWKSMIPIPVPMPPPIHMMVQRRRAQRGAGFEIATLNPLMISPNFMTSSSDVSLSLPIFLLHGKNLSPSFSSTNNGTSMIRKRTGSCTKSAAWKPESSRMLPKTKTANMAPNPFATNMRPFANGISPSGRTSTAKASALTSCNAAKML